MTNAAYDPNNIFAKILKGEIPSVKLYEDDALRAYLEELRRGTPLATPSPSSDEDMEDVVEDLPPLEAGTTLTTLLPAATSTDSASHSRTRRARLIASGSRSHRCSPPRGTCSNCAPDACSASAVIN